MANFFSWYLFFSIFAFGAVIGSFLNCLIWRSWAGESALSGRSYCPKCRHGLAWFDLVPIFSFLILKGKCRYCRKKISWQYPAVELATGLLFLAAALNFSPEIFTGKLYVFNLAVLGAWWLAIACLAVIFVTDARWYFIPDEAVIFLVLAAAILQGANFYKDVFFVPGGDWFLLLGPLLAAVFAGGFFGAVFLASQGRWIGFGDVKYAFAMGLLLGFPGILIGLFLANFFGAIIGLMMICLGRKKMSSEIPFGPFLVAGTLAAMFFSKNIIDGYLSINF